MARRLYPGDVLWIDAGDSDAYLAPGQPFSVWDALASGNDVSADMRANDQVSVIPLVAGADGVRPTLYGPDGYDGVLWCETGAFQRFPMLPIDLLDAVLKGGDVGGGGGGGGVSDHGALAGLADDDHTHYHTDARGDARYYSKAQVDGLVTAAATAASAADRDRGNHTGAQAISSVTNLETRLAAVEAGGGGGGGASSFVSLSVIVASVDASTAIKAVADFVCDGTNDEVQINQAIDRAAALVARTSASPSGAQQRGSVELSGGRFNIGSAILMRTAVRLFGQGWLTELRAVSCNSVGMIALASVNEHGCQVDRLYLYGNYSGGGTCDAINFDMSGSTNTGVGTYPSMSPDSYHHITDLFIDGFQSVGSRNGIKIWCSASANNRGNVISRIQMRNIGNHGIWFVSASDDLIDTVHIGTCGGSGFYLESSNIRLTNCKAFYCDGANGGFYTSGDCVNMSVCEAQECHTGFHIASADAVLTSIVADISRDDGIYVNRSRVVLNGFVVKWKTGMRYGSTAQTNGVRWGASITDIVAVGHVNTSGITNKTSGTAPTTGSFLRIAGAGALVTQG